MKNPFVQRRRSLPSVRSRATTRASLSVLLVLILIIGVNELRCQKYGCISRVHFYGDNSDRGGYVGGGAVIKRPGEETEGGVEVETVNHGDMEGLRAKSEQNKLLVDGLEEQDETKFVEKGTQLDNSADLGMDSAPYMSDLAIANIEGIEREPAPKDAIERVEKLYVDTAASASASSSSSIYVHPSTVPASFRISPPLSSSIASIPAIPAPTSPPPVNMDFPMSSQSDEEISWAGREDDPPSSYFETPEGQEDPIRVAAGTRPTYSKPNSPDMSTGMSPKFGAMDMSGLLGEREEGIE